MPRYPSRKNENILIMSSILVDAMPCYCSWIHNRCPTKNTELPPNILLIVSCSWLVFIRNCVPLIYNNEATFAFLLYPLCNLAILKNYEHNEFTKSYMQAKKNFKVWGKRSLDPSKLCVCSSIYVYIACKIKIEPHNFF